MGLFSRKPKGLKEITPRETAQHIEVVITTSMGGFTAVLHHTKVPKTAQNFIDLCESGFYDGLIFHRVIEDFIYALPVFQSKKSERDGDEVQLQTQTGYRTQSNLHISVATEAEAVEFIRRV